MKKMKLLATAALTTTPAAPARADDHWAATDTAACAGSLVVPVVESVSPLPPVKPLPRCGKGSLIHGGDRVPGSQGACAAGPGGDPG